MLNSTELTLILEKNNRTLITIYYNIPFDVLFELPDGNGRDFGRIAGWENMGMGLKFQMGMGMGWEWECGRRPGGAPASMNTIQRRLRCFCDSGDAHKTFQPTVVARRIFSRVGKFIDVARIFCFFFLKKVDDLLFSRRRRPQNTTLQKCDNTA